MRSAAGRIAREFFHAHERISAEKFPTLEAFTARSWDDLDEKEQTVRTEAAEELLRRHVITEGAAVVVDEMYGHDQPRR